MKKFTAILLAAMLLLFSACSGNDDPVTTAAPTVNRSDTLTIENGDKNYVACLERYYSVVQAMINKVQILEKNHNLDIQDEVSGEYFLEEEYILTPFRPFNFTSLAITKKFVSGMNTEKAQEEFALQSGGMEIEYTANNHNGNILRFVSEGQVLSYETKYKKEGDAMQYTFITETNGEETITERLEFITVAPYTYAIQSTNARCYIEFDKDGAIVYFSCAELKTDSFGEKDSIFASSAKPDRSWINTDKRDMYAAIHTFENGSLYHSECTSGPWKTVTIDSAKYDSEFIQ